MVDAVYCGLVTYGTTQWTAGAGSVKFSFNAPISWFGSTSIADLASWTIANANDGTGALGSGTGWTSGFIGTTIRFDSTYQTITSVDSPTTATVKAPGYPYSSGTFLSYDQLVYGANLDPITTSATTKAIATASGSATVGDVTLSADGTVIQAIILVGNATVGNTSGSAAATVESTASASVSIGSVSTTSTVAGVLVRASASTGIGSLTPSAAAKAPIGAQAAGQLGNVAGSATATATVTAIGSASVGQVVPSIAADEDIATSGSGQLGNITGSATAEVELVASASAGVDAPVSASTTAVLVTASATPSVGNPTASTSVAMVATASVSANLGSITGSGHLQPVNAASLSTSVGTVSGAGLATVEVSAQSAAAVGAVAGSSSATVKVATQAATTVGNVTSSGQAGVVVEGSAGPDIGSIDLVGQTGVVAAADLENGFVGEITLVAEADGRHIVWLHSSIGEIGCAADGTVTSHISGPTAVPNLTTTGTASVVLVAESSCSIGHITSDSATGVLDQVAVPGAAIDDITGSSTIENHVGLSLSSPVPEISGSAFGNVEVSAVGFSSPTISGSASATVTSHASASAAIDDVYTTDQASVAVHATAQLVSQIGPITAAGVAVVVVAAAAQATIGDFAGSGDADNIDDVDASGVVLAPITASATVLAFVKTSTSATVGQIDGEAASKAVVTMAPIISLGEFRSSVAGRVIVNSRASAQIGPVRNQGWIRDKLSPIAMYIGV